MKCKQRLCQKNKNLFPSGNCNVCENAVSDTTKDTQKHDKKIVEQVKVEMNLMVEAHQKLT